MTADYEYDNLPEALEAEAMPVVMFAKVLAALEEAVASGETLAAEAKAVHVYDRKGYLNADSFIGHQNPSYRTKRDDVVLQVTVRIPNPLRASLNGKLAKTAALEESAKEYMEQAEKARLEAEIAQAEQDVAQAEETARAAREKLEAMRNR